MVNSIGGGREVEKSRDSNFVTVRVSKKRRSFSTFRRAVSVLWPVIWADW